MTASELCDLRQTALDVQQGRRSAEQLARECLLRIEALEPLNAFLHVDAELALASARQVDQRRERGEVLGALAGVPIAIKDAICTKDAPTTCASKILRSGSGEHQGWLAPFDATVIERLRQADAVLIGKTNMDEFAMGSSTENSAFGPAKNPWDATRAPGGSSGGSAIAVAAAMAPASLGSDTGGSIRQPASFCGVVGVKPSYGRVSRYGLVAFASSLDQIGPFTRDVRDSARVLEVIAGHDPRDSTSLRAPVGRYEAACERGIRGLKIGVPREYFGAGLEPQVKRAVSAAIEDLERSGASIHDIEMPHTRYGVATYYVIATAEASSNLARFDGVRFGLRVEQPGTDLGTMYGATRDEGFGAEVKRRILLGTYVLSSGYYDAYYGKAQKVRTLIRRDFERAFETVDVIATPTSPTVAFRLGERLHDPLAMYLGDIYQLPASLAGICGISLPCKLVEPEQNLPVGLQLLAPALQEETLFAAAAAHEAAAGPLPSPRITL
jgi:aspartyl-tRNA(Asn)/glutamyl-tRNA(Gln) amidotransferase subunit A